MVPASDKDTRGAFYFNSIYISQLTYSYVVVFKQITISTFNLIILNLASKSCIFLT